MGTLPEGGLFPCSRGEPGTAPASEEDRPPKRADSDFLGPGCGLSLELTRLVIGVGELSKPLPTLNFRVSESEDPSGTTGTPSED